MKKEDLKEGLKAQAGVPQRSFEELRAEYPEFVYENFRVTETADKLVAEYDYRLGELEFHPTVEVRKKDISNTRADREYLEYLFFQYGLFDLMNYYKLTCSPVIRVKAGYIESEQAEFFKKVLFNGLGEYFYRNGIAPEYENFVRFEAESERFRGFDIARGAGEFEGNLVPIGGGKDSIVTLELLSGYRAENKPFMYERNLYPENKAGYETIRTAGYRDDEIVIFRNNLDLQLLDLNARGFLNGHIPFSAGLAMIATLMAYLTGRKYVPVSNEASANEGNVKVSQARLRTLSDDESEETLIVNHQYSKSFEYERDFREYAKRYLNTEIEYFSMLRPWNEWRIVQEFLKHKEYLPVFRSCNRGTKQNIWCNKCSKCLYVYIMLYPYLSQTEMGEVFDEDMLDDPEMSKDFWGLTSDSEVKPFECVGARDEINYALQRAVERDEAEGRKLPKLLAEYRDWGACEVPRAEIEKFWNEENAVPEKYRSLLVYSSGDIKNDKNDQKW